ncbi:MAG: DUF3224 domain-containing protein [Phycisphaeraceae bacterium]|nr:DUF3224 domain-containing protein [Phycisphaeraceae bacterium]
MAEHATGTFDVKLTPMQPDDPAHTLPGRLLIDKRFHGGLNGTSKGQMLAARTAVDGSAGYVALEIVTGTLSGRSGTFVLQHTGTMNRGTPHLVVSVVPDSGTDGFAGLRGSMKIIVEGGRHSYDFDYTMGP